MAMKKLPKSRYRKTRAYERATTMPLRTEKLRVQEVVAENTEQTIVRGTISVPEAKPEVDRVLSTDATGRVKKVNIIPDKVVVEGVLRLEVMYEAFKKDQSVHTFHAELDFTDFVDVPGARPGMEVEVDIVVEDVSLTRDPRCADDWDVAAVVMVTVRVTEEREVDALVECPQSFECESEVMNLEHVVGSRTKQVLIDQEFELPRDNPDIEKVYRCMCDAEITSTKVIKNKVIIEGEVDLECTYTALKDEQTVHTLSRTFKFNTFVEIPGAEQDMDVYVDVMVEACDAEVSDTDACKISVTIVLKVRARVVEDREVNVITEVLGAETVKTANLDVESLVGEECKQVIIRDAKEPPTEKPDIDRIKEVTIRDITIKDKQVINDKVLVRGTVEFQVLYVALKEDQAIHMIHRKASFKTFIDVPGARPDDRVTIDVNVEWVNAKMDGCDLVLEAILEVCARVTETVRRQVVTEVRIPAPTPTPTVAPEVCVPGTTFNYTIARGDTLARLAQRFGTTVQGILAVNPQITDPNMLNVGDVIKIPCVAKG